MSEEKQSRLRARELLTTLDGNVDAAMARRGRSVPSDRTEALLSRVEFLETSGDRDQVVPGYRLRNAYVHLHETLEDMALEPPLLGGREEAMVDQVLAAVRAI